jgi:ubiquinone/menaquinone biosynthesis C-methylase UbiE
MTPDPQPLKRFTGLAAQYARCRPDYPDAAIDFILAHCGIGPGSVVVDVGCGTGISTRCLARRGVPVVGLEPNADMRAQAEGQAVPLSCPAPRYLPGQAEATGLPTGSVDLVLAAQAFHWFDRDAALNEFHRILKPRGWTVLIWNERDESDPFTAAYGAVIRSAPEAGAIEAPRAQAGTALLTSTLFEAQERRVFANQQTLDAQGVLGRAFSASYAPRDPAEAQRFAAALKHCFARFEQRGRVELRYETSVYVGRRRR